MVNSRAAINTTLLSDRVERNMTANLYLLFDPLSSGNESLQFLVPMLDVNARNYGHLETAHEDFALFESVAFFILGILFS
jgi:hypothetical protein